MYNLKMMRNDVVALRGSTVAIFGQPTELREEVDALEVDVIDIIENLEEFESDMTIEELEELYENDILEEVDGGNSYNWAGKVSNDFNYFVYKNTLTDAILIDFKVHKYGDVRGNYTNSVVLEVQDEYDFLEAVSVYGGVIVEVDGIEYTCDFSSTSDMIEVYTPDGDHVTDVSAYDMDDLTATLKEAIS